MGVALALLSVSGTGLGFGIACVAEGDGDAGCVLLVLGPVLVGLPLAGAVGIWGAAERGWLSRWAGDDDEAGEAEGVIVGGGAQRVLRQAHVSGLASGKTDERMGPEIGTHG